MLFSWLVVFGFVVFCFTVILREEGEKRGFQDRVSEEEFDEEIT